MASQLRHRRYGTGSGSDLTGARDMMCADKQVATAPCTAPMLLRFPNQSPIIIQQPPANRAVNDRFEGVNDGRPGAVKAQPASRGADGFIAFNPASAHRSEQGINHFVARVIADL